VQVKQDYVPLQQGGRLQALQSKKSEGLVVTAMLTTEQDV
jgi:hypothetical protein